MLVSINHYRLSAGRFIVALLLLLWLMVAIKPCVQSVASWLDANSRIENSDCMYCISDSNNDAVEYFLAVKDNKEGTIKHKNADSADNSLLPYFRLYSQTLNSLAFYHTPPAQNNSGLHPLQFTGKLLI